ncbi:hypothetical protein PM082_011897 [Marasmius tenuissimus]|nr:hypothetical protein PM082_011897 [Marasmius tenuissimus]
MSYTGSKQNVQELATGAWDTFFLLIAACTSIILACKERQATDPNFDWKWQISQHIGNGDSTPCKVRPAWIHDLIGLFTGDLDAKRIASGQDMLILFGPKRGLMDRLLAGQSCIHSERDTRDAEPSETRSTAEVSSALCLLDLHERVKDVPLYPMSGQRPGELIHDFLEQCRAAQEEKEAEENQSARHQGLQCESEATKSHAPEKKGLRVWHWEKVYLGEGIDEFFCVRTLLMPHAWRRRFLLAQLFLLSKGLQLLAELLGHLLRLW